MKHRLLIVFLLVVSKFVHSQELNTAKAIDSVIANIKWKKVKKIKLGSGSKDWYSKDKNFEKNYRYLIHHDEGISEYIYVNDELVLIKRYSKNLPSEKGPNLTNFCIYKGEVISTFVQGRTVSPAPLIAFASQYKEEAKKMIFQRK